MHSNIKRRLIVLAAGIGAVLTFAACDSASMTQPDSRRTFKPDARHDLDDTLNCLTGYIIVEGRVVCN